MDPVCICLIRFLVFYCNDYRAKVQGTVQIMPEQPKQQQQKPLPNRANDNECAYLRAQTPSTYTFMDENVFGCFSHVEHGFWEQ